jgi:hypothetical protein
MEHEPTITDRLLAYIEDRLDGEEIAGVRWEAKTLTSLGYGAQETAHGADFFGVLELRLPGYRVSKGFLAQAKRIEPGQSLTPLELGRMHTQCKKMVDRSPVSYVFIYSKMSGIRVVSANDILAAPGANPHNLTTWSLKEFFRAHLECFIGDFRIHAPTPKQLEELVIDVSARNGIVIRGETADHDIPPNRFR